MASIFKPRRGTSSENDNFTGANGEVVFDTTNKLFRYHDGETQGGFEVGATPANTSTSSASINDSDLVTFTRADSSTFTLDLSSVQGEVANAYLTSTYTTNTDFQSALANTNAYIASVDSTRASDLANTNAKLLNIESNLLSTNTDIRSAISTEVTNLVDSAPSTLDTLNELAAALGDDANFATTIATNLGQKLGATASITLTGDVTGSGSFSSNSVSIALTDTNLANTNLAIADRLQVANADSRFILASGGTTTGQLNIGGDIIPTANVTYDLGSPTNSFRELYLAGSTITLGGIELSVDEDGDLNIVDPNTGNKVTIGVTNGIIVANTTVVSSAGNVTVPTGFTISTLTAFPEGDLNGDDAFIGESADVLDAFGQDIGGTLFDCSEPKGRLDTSDLGAFA